MGAAPTFSLDGLTKGKGQAVQRLLELFEQPDVRLQPSAILDTSGSDVLLPALYAFVRDCTWRGAHLNEAPLQLITAVDNTAGIDCNARALEQRLQTAGIPCSTVLMSDTTSTETLGKAVLALCNLPLSTLQAHAKSIYLVRNAQGMETER